MTKTTTDQVKIDLVEKLIKEDKISLVEGIKLLEVEYENYIPYPVYPDVVYPSNPWWNQPFYFGDYYKVTSDGSHTIYVGPNSGISCGNYDIKSNYTVTNLENNTFLAGTTYTN